MVTGMGGIALEQPGLFENLTFTGIVLVAIFGSLVDAFIPRCQRRTESVMIVNVPISISSPHQ